MKTKPILFLVITLIIGFVLGMLTSAQLRFNRLKPVRFYFSEERFREGFYKVIEPDEKQKAEIEKILNKYAQINSELQGDFRKSFESNMKEFRKEIDSKLNKEQLARLREMDERREEMIRQGRRGPGDSSDTGGHRRNDRNRRQFDGNRPAGPSGPIDAPVPRDGRPQHPDDGFMPPLPPPDSAMSPDRK